MSGFLYAVIVGLLIVGMLLCGFASYVGYGIHLVGPKHLRSGSVRGPRIVSGGPAAGK